jgi:hypothetical protein
LDSGIARGFAGYGVSKESLRSTVGKSKIIGVQVPLVITFIQHGKALPTSIPYFPKNLAPG